MAESDGIDDDRAAAAARRHPFVSVLAIALVAEALGLLAATIALVVELLVAPTFSVPSAIALAGFCALAAVWLAVMARAVIAGRAWVRGATVVVQVLLVAVAVAALQSGAVLLAVVLAAVAVAAVVLVLTPTVVAHLGDRERLR